MRTIVSIIVGVTIIFCIFCGISYSGNLILDSQTVLKSPRVNVSEDQHNVQVSNLSNDIKINTGSSQSSNRVNKISDLMKQGSLLYGTVANGTKIIIPCKEGVIVDNKLVVPEYYVNMPWKKFTDYITTDNKGNFIITEFYKDKEIGKFNLKQEGSNLVGSLENIGDNTLSKVEFTDISRSRIQSGQLMKKPFYIGVVGKSAVTLTNEFNDHYTAYYHGYKYLIDVVKQENSSDSNYNIQLNEYWKGHFIGEYFLNNVGNDTYTGVLIRYPNKPNPKKITVGLTASNSPSDV